MNSSDLIRNLREDWEILKDGYQENLTKTWHDHAMTGAAEDCLTAASHIEAQDKLLAEMLEAVLSMVYEDGGTWKVGVIGDYEAPEEVLSFLSKALSQKDTP